MSYIGSWKMDDFLAFGFDSHNGTGDFGEKDVDGTPTYRIYKGIIDAPIVTGTLARQDDSNTVGFCSAEVQLTAAEGFEKGKQYRIRIHGIVSGVPANKTLYFQIEAEVSVSSFVTSALTALFASLTSGMTTAGSVGKLLVDNLNAAISSRLASGSYTAPPTAAANAAAVLAAAAATPVKANVKAVNDVTLDGNGSSIPWGPA